MFILLLNLKRVSCCQRRIDIGSSSWAFQICAAKFSSDYGIFANAYFLISQDFNPLRGQQEFFLLVISARVFLLDYSADGGHCYLFPR